MILVHAAETRLRNKDISLKGAKAQRGVVAALREIFVIKLLMTCPL
jgi:hypothetical protein